MLDCSSYVYSHKCEAIVSPGLVRLKLSKDGQSSFKIGRCEVCLRLCLFVGSQSGLFVTTVHQNKSCVCYSSGYIVELKALQKCFLCIKKI